jgi:hypothetical protein
VKGVDMKEKCKKKKTIVAKKLQNNVILQINVDKVFY